eukprot:GGOE01014387.1.p1 GENE.GGOE01014387.1~~GGOE01014387.1.p1  ORF type:complete len:471 (-),score=149.09 GGOE01014387.1:272-1594(-)
MEGYKDVILSVAPAAARTGGFQPTGHVTSTFENYKGILLCDRPSDQHAAAGARPPFLPPGATDDSLGLPPTPEQLLKLQQIRKGVNPKKKGNAVLTQHLKALKALNDQKVQERVDAVEVAMEEQQRWERFQQRQAQLRQTMLTGNAPAELEGALETTKAKPSSPGNDRLPPVAPPPVSHVRSPPAEPKAKGAKGKKAAKPKWAMTEEEAIDVELQETDDLVQFAAGLDFEKYLDDYEIREALSVMKERVEELKAEEEQSGEEAEEGEEGQRHRSMGGDGTAGASGKPWVPARREPGPRRVRLEHQVGDALELLEQNWDNVSTFSSLSERKRRLISEQAIALAEKILSGSSQLRGVHSKQSLARLLEDLTHRVYNAEKAGGAATARPPVDVGKAMKEPVVAVHRPAQYPSEPPQPPRVLTQLKRSPDYVQNLPYMYRCPSI